MGCFYCRSVIVQCKSGCTLLETEAGAHPDLSAGLLGAKASHLEKEMLTADWDKVSEGDSGVHRPNPFFGWIPRRWKRLVNWLL